MPRSRRSGRVDGVWIGLLVSGLIHAIGVAALIDAGSGSDRAASAVDPDEPVPERPPKDERVRLGIAESRQVTVNWIGYADPTPNRGLPSELEQAAMSVVPVGVPVENPSAVPSEASEPGESPTVAEPQEPSLAEPAEPTVSAESQSRETAQPETATAAVQGPVPVEPLVAAGPTPLGPEIEVGLPEPVEVSVESGAASPRDESAEPTDAEPAEERPEAEATPEEAPAKDQPKAEPKPPVRPSKPASDAGGGPSGGDDLPGEISDKESAPTAKDPVVNIDDWGRPAAGEGIEVMPRRPVWGPTIAAVAMPRSPTVLVEFDRTGRVRKASFVKENGKVLSTGSAEVDRVLLNSVYNWRAKGAKIEALPAEGPGSLFRLRMHIRLRM